MYQLKVLNYFFKQLYHWQKQPPELFCKKRYSKIFCKLHRKRPVLQSLFNKVAGLKAFLIKNRLQHMCFLWNFAKVLRTPILQTPANGCFSVDDWQGPKYDYGCGYHWHRWAPSVETPLNVNEIIFRTY